MSNISEQVALELAKHKTLDGTHAAEVVQAAVDRSIADAVAKAQAAGMVGRVDPPQPG